MRKSATEEDFKATAKPWFMRFWPVLLGVAGLLYAFTRPSQDQLEELESLDFPVAFRDDEGCFHLMEKSEQFLDLFELQDLTDEAFQGWDSQGRAFRFLGRRQGAAAYAAVGPADFTGLRQSLKDYLSRASDIPEWSSSEDQARLRAWFEEIALAEP